MTQKDSQQQHNQEQNLEAQRTHLGRCHFLAIGAGAAARFAFPRPVLAQRGGGGGGRGKFGELTLD